ncbi:MAG: 2Fe-2S iron-sulfur cluster-binding protein, partial [Exilispira sp.]
LEGVKKTSLFSIIEDSFANYFASQCGFCTPAMVMATYYAFLQLEESYLFNDLSEDKDKEDELLRNFFKKSIEGNLCRCTGYNQIIDAMKDIYSKIKKKREKDGK